MIEFRCEGCGKGYRVAESNAGRVARCACGARLQIPVPQLVAAGPEIAFSGAAFESPCPSCQAPLGGGDVLCVRCGFNRVTGVKVQTAGDEEAVPEADAQPRPILQRAADPGRWMKLGILGGLAVVLAAGGGYLALRLLVSKYGISDGAPLGRFERIDEHLASMNYRKLESAETSHPKTGRTIRMQVYEDPDRVDHFGDLREKVVVFADAEGRVLAIGAVLAPNPGGMTPSAFTKSNVFLRSYWEEISGEKPKFRAKYSAAPEMGSMAMPEMEEAKFSGERACGRWRRSADQPVSHVVLWLAEIEAAPELP